RKGTAVEADRPSGPAVVKVGGSLYGLPDLGPRLRQWLATLPTQVVLLVPGGGATAEVVRTLYRVHRLGEQKAHWLAFRAVSLNAYFLADLLPPASVVGSPRACASCWENQVLPVVDGWRWAWDDEQQADRLPHSWDVTSDSLAARVAAVLRAP